MIHVPGRGSGVDERFRKIALSQACSMSVSHLSLASGGSVLAMGINFAAREAWGKWIAAPWLRAVDMPDSTATGPVDCRLSTSPRASAKLPQITDPPPRFAITTYNSYLRLSPPPVRSFASSNGAIVR